MNLKIPGTRAPDKARLLLRRGVTTANFTDRLAAAYGDRIAFVVDAPSTLTGTTEISFAGLADATARFATALSRAAVLPNELVAVIPRNGVDYLIAMLAVMRAGAVAVPINPSLKPPEIATLLELSGARAIVCDASTSPSLPDAVLLTLGEVSERERSADVARSARHVQSVDEPGAVPNDGVAAIMYTSGTTGRPKGARLTSEGLLAMTSLAAINPSSLPLVNRAVTALPQAHIMGFATSIMFLYAGITHRMIPHFDAKAVLDAIEHDRADVFVGVPAMYRSLLDAGAEERDLDSVKVWASAADVMPPDLARRFQSFGRMAGPVRALFVEAYGMVETSGVALLRVYPPGMVRRAQSAIPVPPYRIRVVDDDGNVVARGETGELCVKGPGVLRGYQQDGDARVVEDGWLRTGDLARVGLLGGVTLAGRKKEVIKVGGYSVFPVEVEEEIRRHPKVADAAVVALPDERLGAVPAAAVVAEPGAALDARELEEWARETIASYRRPRAWIVVESFPRGATRKVDKPAVAAMFAGARPPPS